MDILKAMMIRRSDRTFTDGEVPAETTKELLDIFNNSHRLNQLPLSLVPFPGKEVENAMTGIVGSYGAIKNAPVWMIGVSKVDAGYQENFGFAMEQFVLECTRRGIGTCWVGGFFKMSVLDQKVKKGRDENIVCITPFGYAAPRRIGERAMRAVGGLNVRKPMSERVFYKKWGNPADEFLKENDNLFRIFESARWAPSASNKQPCHYIFDQEEILILLDQRLQRKWPDFIKKDRAEDLNFQGVDAGIGMAHVFLAGNELGFKGKWSFDFDDGILREKYKVPDYGKIAGVYKLS